MPDEVSGEMPADGRNEPENVNPEPVEPGSSDILVGCADLPPGLRRGRYFERLQYLEVQGTRWQVPKLRALRRWREDAGAAGHFGLLAPQEITDKPGPRGYRRGGESLTAEELAQAGEFRITPVTERAVQSIADACAALDADAVIFRSPPDFAPSAANREAMRAFFTDLASQQRFGSAVRVWEPQGLWDAEVAARFAHQLDLVYACDPASNDPLAPSPAELAELLGDVGYFRITGLGQSRSRFDEFALEPLLELIEDLSRAWIVFTHAHRYPDALRCQRLVHSRTIP